MTGAFGKRDVDLNARLILKMTARGLGFSVKSLLERIGMSFGSETEKMRAALNFASDTLVLPVEMPAFDPSVCQSPTTDSRVIGIYDEFADSNSQFLYPGGASGTIWFKVDGMFPVGVLSAPFCSIGKTESGHVVLKQSYVQFLRQFLPMEERS